MSSPESLSVVDNLDLVTDCGDLRDTFPPNVDLKFVYWTHGDTPESREETSANAAKLAPHLLDVDDIGIEVGIAPYDSPEKVYKGFQLINSFVSMMYKRAAQGKDPRSLLTYEDISRLHGSFEVSNIFFQCVDLVLKIWGETGAKKLRFFPFDKMFAPSETYNPLTDPKYTESRLDPALERDYIFKNAAWHRKREALALRQIHAESKKLSRDKKPHKIGIVYGAAHSPVSVAAHRLGARMERVFIDGSLQATEMQIVNQVRYASDPEAGEVVVREGIAALSIGMYIFQLAHHLELIDQPQIHQIFKNVDRLAYRSVQGTLQASHHKRFKDNMDILVSYSGKNVDNLRSRERRKVAAATIELLDLSTAVLTKQMIREQ